HAMTVARSRSITGPYDVHPDNPLITSRHHPEAYLQKTGHGDFVETQNGEHYAVFLASRPLHGSGRGRCTLGRESAIERIVWSDDGWPRLAYGGQTARRHVEAPDLPRHPFPPPPERLDFDTPTIDRHFQSLRVPMTRDWVDTTSRPGYLRLTGRDSLGSTFTQSLIARRVQSHHIEAATCVEFSPSNFQQMAGLVCYYNTYHYHYLYLAGADYGGDPDRKLLSILTNDKYRVEEPLAEPLDLTGVERVYLKVELDHAALRCFYATEEPTDEGAWQAVGPVLDGSILSDDYVEDLQIRYRPCFTGAFVGLACQDLSGQALHADFDWWAYRELAVPEARSR
ncbi:MAG: family 43 glycosylhydrolase, partial [Acidobacteriota bacterium]